MEQQRCDHGPEDAERAQHGMQAVVGRRAREPEFRALLLRDPRGGRAVFRYQ
jgi:hypothetical protein